jgi:hypothetical protein
MIGSAARAEARPALHLHDDASTCTHSRPNVHSRPFVPHWATRPEEVPA